MIGTNGSGGMLWEHWKCGKEAKKMIGRMPFGTGRTGRKVRVDWRDAVGHGMNRKKSTSGIGKIH